VGFGFGWLAFSSFLFPFHVMNFVHLCPKEKKKKKRKREKYLHHKATGPTKALCTVF
jgi:hypothetical protein